MIHRAACDAWLLEHPRCLVWEKPLHKAWSKISPLMETLASPRAIGLGMNTSHEQKPPPPTCKAAHFTLQNPYMDHSECCPPTLPHAPQTAGDSGYFLPRSPPCISLTASFPGPSPLQSPSAVQGEPDWSSSGQGSCRWSRATGNEVWEGKQGGPLLPLVQLPGDGPGAG